LKEEEFTSFFLCSEQKELKTLPPVSVDEESCSNARFVAGGLFSRGKYVIIILVLFLEISLGLQVHLLICVFVATRVLGS